jgi:hypothetical protein
MFGGYLLRRQKRVRGNGVTWEVIVRLIARTEANRRSSMLQGIHNTPSWAVISTKCGKSQWSAGKQQTVMSPEWDKSGCETRSDLINTVALAR